MCVVLRCGAGCFVVCIVGSVCGAVRGCQFDWIRVMSRRYDFLVVSGADLRRCKDGERRCVCCSFAWCWLFGFVSRLDCVWQASRWLVRLGLLWHVTLVRRSLGVWCGRRVTVSYVVDFFRCGRGIWITSVACSCTSGSFWP